MRTPSYYAISTLLVLIMLVILGSARAQDGGGEDPPADDQLAQMVELAEEIDQESNWIVFGPSKAAEDDYQLLEQHYQRNEFDTAYVWRLQDPYGETLEVLIGSHEDDDFTVLVTDQDATAISSISTVRAQFETMSNLSVPEFIAAETGMALQEPVFSTSQLIYWDAYPDGPAFDSVLMRDEIFVRRFKNYVIQQVVIQETGLDPGLAAIEMAPDRYLKQFGDHVFDLPNEPFVQIKFPVYEITLKTFYKQPLTYVRTAFNFVGRSDDDLSMASGLIEGQWVTFFHYGPDDYRFIKPVHDTIDPAITYTDYLITTGVLSEAFYSIFAGGDIALDRSLFSDYVLQNHPRK